MSDDEEQASGGKLLVRVKPVYCGACGMPPEYCEYGPDYETHCQPWLMKNHPDMYKKLKKSSSKSNKKDGDEIDGDEGEEEVAEDVPENPWTTEERLIAFYEKYVPEKLDSVPSLLEKYAGKEDKLFVALVKKYGPEPEDPYYAAKYGDDDDDESDGDDDDDAGDAKSRSKRRGAAAKKTSKQDTRIVIQKISRNKRKAVTIIVGMETIPGIKLKDATKLFSKKFAGSSSVKDTPKGNKEIILQGDHMDDVARLIVKQYKVSGNNIFLDIDGEFVPFGDDQ